MPNTTIQARISPQMKAQAEEVFAGMGLKTSDAIRMFLQQTINTGGLPFQPHTKQPNAETLAAMEEIERGEGERFETLEELFDSWEDDD